MRSPDTVQQKVRARDAAQRLLARLTTGTAIGALAGVAVIGWVGAQTVPGSSSVTASTATASSTGATSSSTASSASSSSSSGLSSSAGSVTSSSGSSTPVAVTGGSR